MSHEFDALRALGVRLGTPSGREFFDRHIALLTREFGGDLVRDLGEVVARHDLDAARRVCASLCPGTTFEVSETDYSIAVAYSSDRHGGVHIIDSDPFFSLNKAVALATTSIRLDAERRSAERPALCRAA